MLEHARRWQYRTLAWFCLLAFSMLMLLSACGGSSTTNAGNTPTPIPATDTSTPVNTTTPSPTSQATATTTATPTPTSQPTATPRPTPTSPPTVTISIVNMGGGQYGFSPATVTIKAGIIVKWVNNTNVPHTATSDNGVWDSGIINPGGSYSHTFTNAGPFPYDCSVHPYMEASITVS